MKNLLITLFAMLPLHSFAYSTPITRERYTNPALNFTELLVRYQTTANVAADIKSFAISDVVESCDFLTVSNHSGYAPFVWLDASGIYVRTKPRAAFLAIFPEASDLLPEFTYQTGHQSVTNDIFNLGTLDAKVYAYTDDPQAPEVFKGLTYSFKVLDAQRNIFVGTDATATPVLVGMCWAN